MYIDLEQSEGEYIMTEFGYKLSFPLAPYTHTLSEIHWSKKKKNIVNANSLSGVLFLACDFSMFVPKSQHLHSLSQSLWLEMIHKF